MKVYLLELDFTALYNNTLTYVVFFLGISGFVVYILDKLCAR